MRDRQPQAGYEKVPEGFDSLPTEKLISESFYKYLIGDLGLPDEVAQERAGREASGCIPRKLCEELTAAGFPMTGVRVLDLGAGMGGMSAELAARGCEVVALEPGKGWRAISARRLASAPRASVIGAVGEQLPFKEGSFDVVVSLQVLEHVADPEAVIQEVFRVLKPGGHFYAAYENYLSFWEPHYRVAWLPLLPKSLGAIYLQMRGRSPRFLKESVTYTTALGVQACLHRAGFASLRQQELVRGLAAMEKSGPKWKILRSLAKLSPKLAVGMAELIEMLLTAFRTTSYIFVIKPRVRAPQTQNGTSSLVALSEAISGWRPVVVEKEEAVGITDRSRAGL